MRTFPTSWWAKTFTAVLILLAMLLTACGGSGNNGNGSSTNTSPIKVGVIGPMSGFESFIGPDILKGVQIAVDQINANGGIMGRQVQIVTAGDAVDAVPALRKLINVDQVNLIVGPSSLEAQAVLPILQ